jgi:hypothetical protein
VQVNACLPLNNPRVLTIVCGCNQAGRRNRLGNRRAPLAQKLNKQDSIQHGQQSTRQPCLAGIEQRIDFLKDLFVTSKSRDPHKWPYIPQQLTAPNGSRAIGSSATSFF